MKSLGKDRRLWTGGSKGTQRSKAGFCWGSRGQSLRKLQRFHILWGLKMGKDRSIFFPYCIKTQEKQQFFSLRLKIHSKIKIK